MNSKGIKIAKLSRYENPKNNKTMETKVKKIKVANYLTEQTAFQIGAMWRDCGYKVVYIY